MLNYQNVSHNCHEKIRKAFGLHKKLKCFFLFFIIVKGNGCGNRLIYERGGNEMKKKHLMLLVIGSVFLFVFAIFTTQVQAFEKKHEGFGSGNCVRVNSRRESTCEKYNNRNHASKNETCLREDRNRQTIHKKCQKQLKNKEQNCYNRGSRI